MICQLPNYLLTVRSSRYDMTFSARFNEGHVDLIPCKYCLLQRRRQVHKVVCPIRVEARVRRGTWGLQWIYMTTRTRRAYPPHSRRRRWRQTRRPTRRRRQHRVRRRLSLPRMRRRRQARRRCWRRRRRQPAHLVSVDRDLYIIKGTCSRLGQCCCFFFFFTKITSYFTLNSFRILTESHKNRQTVRVNDWTINWSEITN